MPGRGPKPNVQTLTLNGSKAEVVGVMPAGFQWFVRKGSLSGKPSEMWSPFGLTARHRVRAGRDRTVAIAAPAPAATAVSAEIREGTPLLSQRS